MKLTAPGVFRLVLRPGLLTKLQQAAPLLTAIVLSLLFAATLTWQISHWFQLIHTPAPSQTTRLTQQTAPSDVTRLNVLFGNPPPSPQSFAVPDVSSSMVLLGSLVNHNPQQSSAIISYNGAPPQLYKAGQNIGPGLQLHSVHADRIEVLRNGQREVLRFPKPTSYATLNEPLQQNMEPPPPDQPTDNL